MASIQLKKRTSVEFTLFEKFAWFLTELKYAQNDKISKNDFYTLIGKEFLGGEEGLSFLDARSVANIFVDTKEYAEIEEDRFKLFCKQFANKYESLSLDDQRKYIDINIAFTQWRDKIFKEKKLQLNTPASSLQQNLFETEFQKVFEGRGPVYRYRNKPNVLYYADWLYNTWIKQTNHLISSELLYNNGENTIDPDSRMLRVPKSGLDLFIIKEDKISKKQIYFIDIREDLKYIYSGDLFTDDSQRLCEYHYYLLDNILILEPSMFEKYSGNKTYTYIFQLSEALPLYTVDACYGCLITNTDRTEIEIHPAVCRKTMPFSFIKEPSGSFRYPEKPKLFTYELNDEAIPFKIRSFLKEKEEDFSKEILNQEFISKALVYFFHHTGKIIKKNFDPGY